MKKPENPENGKTLADLVASFGLPAAASVFILGWGVAHFLAEPCTRVSIWGMWDYTKSCTEVSPKESPDFVYTPKPIIEPIEIEDVEKAAYERSALAANIATRTVSLGRMTEQLFRMKMQLENGVDADVVELQASIDELQKRIEDSETAQARDRNRKSKLDKFLHE